MKHSSQFLILLSISSWVSFSSCYDPYGLGSSSGMPEPLIRNLGNPSLRAERSVGSGGCTLTKETLNDLRKNVTGILNEVEMSSESCKVDEEAETCEQWFRLVQCSVRELSKKMATNSEPLDKANKWKSAYDTILNEYQKDVSNVKTQLSKEFQEKVDKFTAELKTMEAAVNENREKLIQTAVKLCASEIGSGNVDKAYQHFKEINDNSKLKEITKMAYNDYGKKKNVQNIVNFVKKLPNCDYDNLAFPGVYEAMKENNEFQKPEVTILYEAVKQCMCNSELKKDLEKYAKKVGVEPPGACVLVDLPLLAVLSNIITFSIDNNHDTRYQNIKMEYV